MAAIEYHSPTVGPTDDGRSKPDITAPGGFTSYSTPYVSGCAAILMQAAARGDGGSGTQTSAGDIRTVKALLLNGATKPTGWSHTSTQPLGSQSMAPARSMCSTPGRSCLPASRPFPPAETVSRGEARTPSTATNGRFLRGWDFDA